MQGIKPNSKQVYHGYNEKLHPISCGDKYCQTNLSKCDSVQTFDLHITNIVSQSWKIPISNGWYWVLIRIIKSDNRLVSSCCVCFECSHLTVRKRFQVLAVPLSCDGLYLKHWRYWIFSWSKKILTKCAHDLITARLVGPSHIRFVAMRPYTCRVLDEKNWKVYLFIDHFPKNVSYEPTNSQIQRTAQCRYNAVKFNRILTKYTP